MYTLVRRFIKTGIFFLAVGLVIGLDLMAARELGRGIFHPLLVSAHTHALFSGFVMFLILGVALWLFPRPAKDDRRYTPGRIAACYWILTIATGTRIFGEVARAFVDVGPLRWAVLVAGAGQVAGFLFYFWTIWGRIRPLGSRLREERGERF